MEMLGGEGAVQVLAIHPQLFKHRINLAPSVRKGIVPAELLPWGSDFERSTLRLRLLSTCYTNYKRCAAKLNRHDEAKTIKDRQVPACAMHLWSPKRCAEAATLFWNSIHFPGIEAEPVCARPSPETVVVLVCVLLLLCWCPFAPRKSLKAEQDKHE